MSIRFRQVLICACLFLLLGACGNKGPLQLPDEEPKKSKSEKS